MEKDRRHGRNFNPIHTGHLLLAQWAMEEAGLNGILFMPTGNSYMKDRGEMLPGSERLAMTRLAVADRDCFACSDLEVRRGGNTYTYETLEALQNMYPQAHLYFILGGGLSVFYRKLVLSGENLPKLRLAGSVQKRHAHEQTGNKTAGIGRTL